MTSGETRYQSQVLQQFSRSQAYAEEYHAVSSAGHFYTTRLRRVCELLTDCPGGRALDVGCGPGMMFRYLLDRGFECFGVDLSPNMIEECQRQFGQERRAHFGVGTIERLVFPDSFFDVILCMGVLEYVDVQPAVREMVRVLKPNGTLVVSMLNGRSPYRFWERVVYAPAVKVIRAARGNPLPATPDVRTYSERALGRLLTDHQLKIVDVVYFDFNLCVPPLDRRRPDLTVRLSSTLESLARSPLQGLGTGFLVKTCKRSPD
jgi:ubiquinone/menaquinone biosynthesis C-methylase UbiE